MQTASAARTAAVLILSVVGTEVEAQNAATRAEVIAAVQSLEPACAAQDPGSHAALEVQRQYWQSMQTCLAAGNARRRVAALGQGPEVQAGEAFAAIQAQEMQRQLAAFEKEVANQQDFLGWSWGVGFGISIAGEERIEEATIVNDVVRSSKDSSNQARLFLEYHWYPERWQSLLKRNGDGAIVRAQGPFVAVSSRDDEALSGVGAGWSIGFRDKDKSEGFGISIGVMLDNDVTLLADGFKDGEPPPEGETDIRTESKSRISYVLFFTRTF